MSSGACGLLSGSARHFFGLPQACFVITFFSLVIWRYAVIYTHLLQGHLASLCLCHLEG